MDEEEVDLRGWLVVAQRWTAGLPDLCWHLRSVVVGVVLLVIDGHIVIANEVFLFMACRYGGACSFLAQSFSYTGMTIRVM